MPYWFSSSGASCLPSLAYSQSTLKPTSTIASSGGKAHSESYTDHKPACPLISKVHSNRRPSRRARRRPPPSLAPNAPTVPDSPKFAVHRLPIELVFCLVYRPLRMPSRLARSRLRCPSHRTSCGCESSVCPALPSTRGRCSSVAGCAYAQRHVMSNILRSLTVSVEAIYFACSSLRPAFG